MRGIRGRQPREMSDYSQGFVAGVVTVVGLLVLAQTAIAAYVWASTHAVLVELWHALTTPALSVLDIAQILFVLLVALTIIQLPRLLRGAA